MHRRHFCRLAGSALAMTQVPTTGWTDALPVSVDTHAHTFLHTLPMVLHRRYTPDYDASLTDYLDMLDANGSTHGVLIQPSFLGFDNSYLVAAIKKHPERLRGIAVLEPQTNRAALTEFDRSGIVGVRLNLIGEPDPDLRSPLWRSHLKDLADLGWQVEIQAEAARLQDLIPPLAGAGLKVVIDHFGRPDATLGVKDPGFKYLLTTAKTGMVYVKLSAPYRLGEHGRGEQNALAAAPQLIDNFGTKHLMWGSDWPHTEFEKVAPGPVQARKELDAWIPDEGQRREILGATPLSLFKLAKNSERRRAI